MTEKQLFHYLKKHHYCDLKKSSDEMSRWDCYSYIWNELIELKCRNTHYDKLIIEKKKFDALIKRAGEGKAIYICSTPKGIFKFTLNDLIIKFYKRQMPTTTHFENRDKVFKLVGYLHTQHAKQLK